ncbi:hypothetical protein OIO07_06420 [Bacillus paralicheniformis]|uniref:Uncharacterized protein n=1 Tax=Bacillus paralicheniformis TaxID=1648923 RepID=A0A6I7TG00_9BACI|nr:MULTISPECIES: hypothetical protein [Bacillus]ETB70029.1 hypothetical protein A943_18760 [Bacillus sp. CPSM8]AGN35982.1 hypothetical protein BaLi_c16140 [Bacillus paralicheniformis ATCC 9945a]AJO17814.1 hypothetical protein SC10_B2orf02414 [Bacillus paralicheniformis]MBL7475026.1 hypothetical protein [Bacillus paralicheniformis]MBR8663635.1 hypothetical protein [Bacillus paralicheniformis]
MKNEKIFGIPQLKQYKKTPVKAPEFYMLLFMPHLQHPKVNFVLHRALE